VDKDEALTICFLNLKGYKDKDLLRTAEALQYLKNLPEYRSNEKVGNAVGVSAEVVREFLTLFKLPEPIQELFRTRQLTRLEQSRRLWQLAKRRPTVLEETAQAISDVSAWDGRHLIEHLLRNPDISVSEAKRSVLQSKPSKETEYHVVAILSPEDYSLLAKEADNSHLSSSSLVTSIVVDWLRSRSVDGRAV
jgi:hypothetical protein